jgi:hypothetical protein
MKKLHNNEMGFSAIEAVVILVIVVLVGLSGWLVYAGHHKKPVSTLPPVSTTPIKNVPASDVCYLLGGRLDCVNDQGKGLVTHRLSEIGGSPVLNLIPNNSDTKYIDDNGSLWLVSSSLGAIKQLKLPSGLTYNSKTISWSQDGQSLFLELDKSSTDRQIYQYVIATDKVVPLTTKGENTSPSQVGDGHVIYTHFGSDTKNVWQPYAMNVDGSQQQPLIPFTTNFAGLSYDSASDTIFVEAFGHPGALQYGTINDFFTGSTPQSIAFDVQVSGNGDIMQVNSNLMVWHDAVSPTTTEGKFVNLTYGTIVYTISQYGLPIGVLPNVNLID